jgi:Uma2 family endonuclease
MPDDGKRYESFGGVLTVTPSPAGLHQRVVARLFRILDDAAPSGTEVLPSPYDWWISQIEWYVPDVVVLRREDFDPRGPLKGTPLLAVEVASPSTRLHDLNAKRAAYAANGCPVYWIVDPEEPSLLVLHLDGDSYREVVRVVGEDVYQADLPFPVTVVPAQLVE